LHVEECLILHDKLLIHVVVEEKVAQRMVVSKQNEFKICHQYISKLRNALRAKGQKKKRMIH
jgi:hypothetical protein